MNAISIIKYLPKKTLTGCILVVSLLTASTSYAQTPPPPGWEADTTGWQLQFDTTQIKSNSAPQISRDFFSQREPDSEEVRKQRHFMRMRNQARQFEFMGQHERALDLYRELLAEQPGDRQTFEGIRRTLSALGRQQDLIELLQERLANANGQLDRTDLIAELGGAYYDADQAEMADSVWQAALEQEPVNSRNFQQVASVQLRLRLLDRAIETYHHGREVLNDPYLFSINLSGLYAAQMNWKKSAEEYLHSLAEHENRLAFVRRGLANFPDQATANEAVTGLIEDKLEERGREPWPGYRNALRKLLIDQKKKNADYAGALPEVAKLDDNTEPAGHRLLEFAAEALEEGFEDVAVQALDIAADRMEDADGRGVVNLMRADIAERNEEIDRAVELLTDVLQDPGSARVERAALMRRGLLRLDKLGNPAGAVDDFRKVRIVGWPEHDRRLDYYEALAFVRLDSLDAALAILRSANIPSADKPSRSSNITSASDRIDPSLLTHLAGRILLWKADREQATALLDSLIMPPSGTDAENETLQLLHLISTVQDSSALDLFARADRAQFQNNTDLALMMYDSLASAENVPEALRIDADYQSSLLRLEEKADPSAVPAFAERYPDHPRTEEIWYRYADWQLKNGDLLEASVAYEMILMEFPNGLLESMARLRLEELTVLQIQPLDPSEY